MNCREQIKLSSYLDGECPTEEALEVERHLDSCADCRIRLRAMRASQIALRAFPVPAMPADFSQDLQGLVRPSRPRDLKTGFPAGLFSRSAGLAFSLAACFAVVFWAHREGLFIQRLDLPIDLLMAAHNQYSLTMPLAPAEKILSEAPVRLAGDIQEQRDVY